MVRSVVSTMSKPARLKECCCGCSVRTGTLIVLWTDAMLSAFMGMIFLLSGHGVSAGINLFKSLAEYSYNAAKFFYYQSKSFGGDANIEDFEAVLRTSQRIDPNVEHYTRIICTILFYWNMFLMLIALFGIIAVHQKQHFLLLLYGTIKVLETICVLFVVSVCCFKIPLPSFWLIAFPGLINIGLKIYGTAVVHSYWGEMQYIKSEECSYPGEDMECATKKPLQNSHDYCGQR